MEFDIDNWIKDASLKLKDCFGDRLLFFGLQGSYKRGEASENSDIDLVTVLDELSVSDLEKYKNIIASQPFSEKACGFICGNQELSHWAKFDLFQLIFDTRPFIGNLCEITCDITPQDAKNAVKINAQNLYHMTCHGFLYDKDRKEVLAELFKPVFFILQAQNFYLNNQYAENKKDLLTFLSGEDKEILELCMNRQNIVHKSEQEVIALYNKLINWCSEKIAF